jgi:hypothetical protein
MLGLPMTNYRYQMDLEPLISLLAILGYIPISRFVAAHRASRAALVCVTLLVANVTISHLDLLQGKLSSFVLDGMSRARVYNMTYPVSAFFAPENGSGVRSASKDPAVVFADVLRSHNFGSRNAGGRTATAANN